MMAHATTTAFHVLQARGKHELNDHELWMLTFVTRFASTLSALGVITILTTFAVSRHFRNPMHRLIVINALYNAFDVVCTMISTSGYKDGDASALCQFQGFLNQMFPVADVLWTLAMAINVYLIVFRSYDAQMLRKLEWKYAAVITLITFIPAFVGLFIRTEEKGPFYGGVTLWCAIGSKWVLFRIVIYYVPIWISIVTTITLYLIVGIEIARRRRILRSISRSSSGGNLDDTIGIHAPNTRASQPPPPHSDSCANSSTGDYVQRRDTNDADSTDYYVDDDDERRLGVTSWVESPSSSSTTDKRKSYKLDAPTRRVSISISHSHRHTLNELPSASVTAHASAAPPSAPSGSPLSFRQYILMPLFFFFALLLVWVCPSTNRVAIFVNPDFFSYPLHLMVGITGSLRGFWNGIVFVVVGMRSWKRRKEGVEVGPGGMAMGTVRSASSRGG